MGLTFHTLAPLPLLFPVVMKLYVGLIIDLPAVTSMFIRTLCSTLDCCLCRFRKTIIQSLQNTPDSILSCKTAGWEDSVLREMSQTKFCIIVPGDTTASRRLAEIIMSGCVPVFLGPPFAPLPLDGVVNWSNFALGFYITNHREWMGSVLPHPVVVSKFNASLPLTTISDLSQVPAALARVGPVQLASLLQNLHAVRPLYSFIRHGDSPVSLPDVMYSRMCFHATYFTHR